MAEWMASIWQRLRCRHVYFSPWVHTYECKHCGKVIYD